MTDADVVRRRALASATLRTPNGVGFLADLTARLAGVQYSTRAGVGYERLTARVLSRGLLDAWPEAELSEAFDHWGLGVLEFCEGGEVVWVGRVADMKAGPLMDDPGLGPAYSGLELECEGAAYDLAAEPAVLPANATEDQSITVSALLLALLEDYGGLVEADGALITSPGVDVGPISDAGKETAFDVLARILTAGSTASEEFTFLAYWLSGHLLPILRSRDSGRARWRIPMLGTALAPRINLRELATRVSAQYTDENSTQRQTDPSIDAATEQRYGLIRHRVVSLERVNAAGAATGQATYLAAHKQPVGLTGSLQLVPRGELYAQAPNAEAALEPCWRVRAGDLVEVPDFLPSSIYVDRRQWVIESTSRDVDAGAIDVTLDQRRLMPRMHEDPAFLAPMRRALEPMLNPGTVFSLIDQTTITLTNAPAVDFDWDPGEQEFQISRTREYEISLISQFKKENANTGFVFVGFALEGATWDTSDQDHAHRDDFPSSANPSYLTLEHKVSLRLGAGRHMINCYGRNDTGAGNVLWYGHSLTIR